MPYQTTAEMVAQKIKPEQDDTGIYLPATFKIRVEDESGEKLKNFLQTAKERSESLKLHFGHVEISGKAKNLNVKFDQGDEEGIQSPLEIKLSTSDLLPEDQKQILDMVKSKDNLFQFTAESYQNKIFEQPEEEDQLEEEQEQPDQEQEKVPVGAGEGEEDSSEIYHNS